MGEHQFVTEPRSLKEGERIGTWARTNTGRIYYPLDLRPDEVEIEDIANALGNICRYGGHVDSFWSVAQHSYLISCLVEPYCKTDEERWLFPMWGLMHDAHEAYLGDLIRPLKKFLFLMAPELKAAIERADDAICTKFNIPRECPSIVQHLDEVMLESETLMLRPNAPLNYSTHGEDYQEQKLEPARDWKSWVSWAPDIARDQFLNRFDQIESMRRAA